MGSPATPITPSAAPAAAPAPVSAPAAAAPAAAPVAPASPVAPAGAPEGVGAGIEASGAPEAPASPAGGQPAAAAQPAAEPKSGDYPASQEGLEKFIREHDQWAQQNPEAADAAEAARQKEGQPDAQPEEQINPDQPKPEEKKAEEPAPAAELPKAFDEAIQADPALKAALAANPAAQKLVMEAARLSETAKPILAIAPTLEDAQFMQLHANTMLDLKHNFLMGVDNPDARTAGWEGMKSQFVETDDKGAPLKDAAGNPVYGKDFDMCLLTPAAQEKLGGLRDTVLKQIADLEAKANGFYPSEAAKNADANALADAQYTRDALNYALSLLTGESAAEALPALPPDATPEQKAFQEKLQKQQEELNKTKADSGKAAQTQQVQQYESKMRLNWQSGVGEALDQHLSAMKERGVYIPDYIQQQPWVDPVSKQPTKVPALAVQVLFEFDQKMDAMTLLKNNLQRLQRLGVSVASTFWFTCSAGKGSALLTRFTCMAPPVPGLPHASRCRKPRNHA